MPGQMGRKRLRQGQGTLAPHYVETSQRLHKSIAGSANSKINADSINENELLDILKPVINSESVWTSHALYLIAEFFYSKNEKQKSKEFFNQIVMLDNANEDLKIEAQKRLNRDLSD